MIAADKIVSYAEWGL